MAELKNFKDTYIKTFMYCYSSKMIVEKELEKIEALIKILEDKGDSEDD